MLPKRTKEEKRKLIKEFTKEHKEFIENMINRIKDRKSSTLWCMGLKCDKCPFVIANSTKRVYCSNKDNLLGIISSECKDIPYEDCIKYLQEIINDCYDEKSHKKENKNYNIKENNLIKRYTLTDKVKRREMIYGEILFKNISFIASGGTIIIINENKTGGVVYGKAKKYFRKLSKQNPMYILKSIKHLSNDKIEQISFRVEENTNSINNAIYNI